MIKKNYREIVKLTLSLYQPHVFVKKKKTIKIYKYIYTRQMQVYFIISVQKKNSNAGRCDKKSVSVSVDSLGSYKCL